jgi:glycosyltransferase involved in cell wall biosynthesis
VSVVIPVHNQPGLVWRAIASVRSQGFDDGEIIVVDDGSTDETRDEFEALRAAHITIVQRAHAGPSTARNAGAELAAGTWLLFLDCDDELLPGAVDTFRQLAAPGTALVSAGLLRCTPDGERLVQPQPVPELGDVSLARTAGSFLIRRTLFETIGGYDAALHFGENTDLLLRAAEYATTRDVRVVAVDQPTVRYWAATDQAGYDRARLSAAEHLLSRGRVDLVARATRARLHGIAAVNASRCRHYASAVRHAVAAVRLDPRQWRHVLRLGAALTGPLGRWWWSSARRRRIS